MSDRYPTHWLHHTLCRHVEETDGQSAYRTFTISGLTQGWPEAQCLPFGSTNSREGSLCSPQLSPTAQHVSLFVTIDKVVPTHTSGKTTCFLQDFQQSVCKASPPANIYLLMTVLTLLSCHFEETISYLVLRVVLHLPSTNPFLPMSVS